MRDVYIGQLVSFSYLEHYGKGHDDNPPGRGSGRYAYGSSNNAFVKKVRQVEKESSNNPLPLTDSPPNIKEVSRRGNLSLEEAKDCITLASRKYYLAKKLEPKITSDFIKAVSDSNSKCYGLDHRLKTITSTAAKIGSEAKEKKVDFKEASDGIKDTIRYTAILDRNSFKDSYESIKKNLEENGYEEVRLKNYFQKYRDREAKHKAVQSVYKTSHGFNFEVQFQTSESQAAKELKLPLYNEARQTDVSTKRRMQLENEMERLADRVSDPAGIYELLPYDRLLHSDELMHYGKGHDDNPPGRGSGRYPYGSGDRPHQHDEKLKNDIREHYRKNAKNANIEKGYQKRRFRTVGLDTSNPKFDLLKAGSTLGRYSDNNVETLENRKYVYLTSADKMAYKDAFLSGGLGNKNKSQGAFRYDLKAEKDIKIAKADDVERYVLNKYASDGQKIMYDFLKEIDAANGYITTWRLNTSKDDYQKKMGAYVTKGKNITQQFFNDHMMSNPKQMQETLDHFYKLGFDAIVDPEDEIGGFSYPMILIRPSESVAIDKVHKVRPFKDST